MEEVRSWVMLIQYTDEVDALVNTLTRRYGRR
jgi:hypothetical protein